MSSSGRATFALNYEQSPITLIGGITALFNVNALTINALTQNAALALGLTGPVSSIEAAPNFATFVPLPGGTLIEQDIGDYPLANQTVAANAVIAKPLMISVMMIAPARLAGDYVNKQAFFSSLRTTLAAHNNLGGLYNVNTPAYFYQNCIMRRIVDITDQGDKQVQAIWRIDFVQPLVTLAAAQAAQNSLMQKMSDGSPLMQDKNGSVNWSGSSSLAGSQLGASPGQVFPISQNVASVGLTGGQSPATAGFGVPPVLTQPTSDASQTALTAFTDTKAATLQAVAAVNSAGSSIAGPALSACRAAQIGAQTSALYAAIPGRGLVSAQLSLIPAQSAIQAAQQALQLGYAGSVSDQGLGDLHLLVSLTTQAYVSAQAAVANALTP